jgi:hypothetical protein
MEGRRVPDDFDDVDHVDEHDHHQHHDRGSVRSICAGVQRGVWGVRTVSGIARGPMLVLPDPHRLLRWADRGASLRLGALRVETVPPFAYPLGRL